MPRTYSVTDVEISVRTVQQAVELGMKAEFDRILEPYYEDSEPLLTRELIHCNTVYFARGADGTLLGFFLVGWGTILVSGRPQNTVYLGLSANAAGARKDFSVRELYERFRLDGVAWEAAHRASLLLWFTTASVAAYLGAARVFADLQPTRDGAIASNALEAFRSLRLRYTATGGDHLAVLRGVAQGTRYLAGERSTLARVAAEKGCTLLSDLGVYEENGDRLLCICSARRPDG